MNKKLYKSNTNKMICGVCGGLGEFFGIDPTIIRLIWAILALLGGTGIVAYLIAAVIIPNSEIVV
ncbi:PspC domain-containing protein [Pseudoflavonifractor sp. MSJ-30]|uniref:PspC domain-containing protein n=1 Tax=Pseudoflavonifractor sp. MSJ-30 TaxID=2841525 RepID=UPI001C10A75B|nr:PspC domain-containing protein [Pseudoflavonifractor sp. MSJ-30]MBU5452667.1 PspC domain-containing protein [Pseudoflavonifractor sp. MSJ-30]